MAVMLTDVICKQAKIPAQGRRTVLYDKKVTGLALRVTAKGARSWSVEYKTPEGERHRYTIGSYRGDEAAGSGYTLGEARKLGASVIRDVDAGLEPLLVRTKRKQDAAAVTVETLAADWISRGRGKDDEPWKPKTAVEFARIVDVEIVPALGDLHPEDVTKAQIRKFFDRVDKRSPSMAKHALVVLRLLYKWASSEDRIASVPTFPEKNTQSTPRARILTPGELRAVLATLDKGITHEPAAGGVELMAEAFRLMLLTGQRRGEVISMAWHDVNEDWWTIPSTRHKSGHDHRVPLTPAAVDSLKRLHSLTGGGVWVFPGPRAGAKVGHVSNPQKAAERLWQKSGVEGAVVHDMRRSCASYMAEAGVTEFDVGKVLGHSSQSVTGARYNRYAYDKEKRAALTTWAAELARIAAGEDVATPAAAKLLPWSR